MKESKNIEMVGSEVMNVYHLAEDQQKFLESFARKFRSETDIDAVKTSFKIFWGSIFLVVCVILLIKGAFYFEDSSVEIFTAVMVFTALFDFCVAIPGVFLWYLIDYGINYQKKLKQIHHIMGAIRTENLHKDIMEDACRIKNEIMPELIRKKLDIISNNAGNKFQKLSAFVLDLNNIARDEINNKYRNDYGPSNIFEGRYLKREISFTFDEIFHYIQNNYTSLNCWYENIEDDKGQIVDYYIIANSQMPNPNMPKSLMGKNHGPQTIQQGSSPTININNSVNVNMAAPSSWSCGCGNMNPGSTDVCLKCGNVRIIMD